MTEQEITYLFDVDGVITHPETRTAPKELLSEIAEALHGGIPVVFNTGRSIEWLSGPVLRPFLDEVTDSGDLRRFLVVGEMGGTWIEGDDLRAARQPKVDAELSVPTEIQAEAKRLTETEFNKSMFYDSTKRTMVSIEMGHGISVEAFKPEQKRLVAALEGIVAKHDDGKNLIVHADRIATNIMERHMGKSLGVDRMVRWMGGLSLDHKRYTYVAFGDSRSDVEMANRLQQLGVDVTFVYVGEASERAEIERKADFPVVGTEAHCEQGTLEYLRSQK